MSIVAVIERHEDVILVFVNGQLRATICDENGGWQYSLEGSSSPATSGITSQDDAVTAACKQLGVTCPAR